MDSGSWVATVVYVAGYLFTYRKAYVALVESIASDRYGVDRTETAGAAALSLLLCSMWPAVIVGWVVWRFLTPVTPSEKAAELREREARIKRLERELGIGDGRG